MRESALEAYFRQVVRSMGGMTEKLAPVHAGIPDRLVLLPGGHVELVELKTDRGRLREVQRHWHGQARERGVSVTVLAGRGDVDAWRRAWYGRIDEAFADPPRPRAPRAPRRPRTTEPRRGQCPVCGRVGALTGDGRTLRHGAPQCPGSGEAAVS